MNLTRKTAVVGTVVAALAAAATVVAPTASATSYNGCAYPRVCFYIFDTSWVNGTPEAAYQDITSSYQTLGSKSRGANYVYNSRNSDFACLKVVDNTGWTDITYLPPNYWISFGAGSTVYAVKITAPGGSC